MSTVKVSDWQLNSSSPTDSSDTAPTHLNYVKAYVRRGMKKCHIHLYEVVFVNINLISLLDQTPPKNTN